MRFVRRAVAFMAGGGESDLAETSPMKDWDAGGLNEWLAGPSALDAELRAARIRVMHQELSARC